MLISKAEEIASYVSFNILAKWRIEPNYVAVSALVFIMRSMWRVFKLLDKPTVLECMLVCKCRFLKCFAVT